MSSSNFETSTTISNSSNSNNTTTPSPTSVVPEIFQEWEIAVVLSIAGFLTAVILFFIIRAIKYSACCQQNCAFLCCDEEGMDDGYYWTAQKIEENGVIRQSQRKLARESLSEANLARQRSDRNFGENTLGRKKKNNNSSGNNHGNNDESSETSRVSMQISHAESSNVVAVGVPGDGEEEKQQQRERSNDDENINNNNTNVVSPRESIPHDRNITNSIQQNENDSQGNLCKDTKETRQQQQQQQQQRKTENDDEETRLLPASTNKPSRKEKVEQAGGTYGSPE